MVLYAVWCAGIVLKGVAAYRMVRNGLAKTLFPVWTYLMFGVIYLSVLIALRPYWTAYLRFYTAGIPFVLLAKCAATVCLFWALAANYRSLRAICVLFFGLFTAVGVIAAWVTSFLPSVAHIVAPWLWNAALSVERYGSAVIAGTLLSTLLLLPRAPRIPIPRCATRAAQVMIFDAVTVMISAWFAQSYAYTHPLATALLSTLFGIVTGAAWLSVRPFEELPVDLPTPAELEQVRRRLGLELHLRAARDQILGGSEHVDDPPGASIFTALQRTFCGERPLRKFRELWLESTPLRSAQDAGAWAGRTRR
jgi:hypothetical protein